jgi:molybdenum cofactor cytidylyltransferase
MVTAIVLAAGLSRRMGRFKLLLPWGARTVIGQVVATREAAGVAEVVVVTGHRATDVAAALAGTSARIVFNPDYATGEMLSSIQTGLRAANPKGLADPSGLHAPKAALLCLGDQPQMEVATVRAVLTAGAAAGWEQIIVPSFQMRGGHPTLLPRAIWPDILAATDTLRTVLVAHKNYTYYLSVDTPSVLADLDTMEDYELCA